MLSISVFELCDSENDCYAENIQKIEKLSSIINEIVLQIVDKHSFITIKIN